MRKELDKAQQTVIAMKRSVHVAERNLHVSQLDQDKLSKDLAQNVGKIGALVGRARKLREHRAEMIEGIKATRRTHANKTRVIFTCMQLCYLSPYDLIPTFLAFV